MFYFTDFPTEVAIDCRYSLTFHEKMMFLLHFIVPFFHFLGTLKVAPSFKLLEERNILEDIYAHYTNDGCKTYRTNASDFS